MSERQQKAEIQRLHNNEKRWNELVEKYIKREAVLKSLLKHAADTIEAVTIRMDFIDRSIWEIHGIPDLIAKLRKAAE